MQLLFHIVRVVRKLRKFLRLRSMDQTISRANDTVNTASDNFVNVFGRICSCVTRRKAIREDRMWHVGVKWSEVARTTAGRFLFFFFFSDCPTIAMRKRVPTLFEYDHYYENGKSTTIMRDSQRFEQCPRLWTGANGNKTVPERQRRLLVASFVPPSRPACHRVTLLSVIWKAVVKRR